MVHESLWRQAARSNKLLSRKKLNKNTFEPKHDLNSAMQITAVNMFLFGCEILFPLNEKSFLLAQNNRLESKVHIYSFPMGYHVIKGSRVTEQTIRESQQWFLRRRSPIGPPLLYSNWFAICARARSRSERAESEPNIMKLSTTFRTIVFPALVSARTSRQGLRTIAIDYSPMRDVSEPLLT